MTRAFAVGWPVAERCRGGVACAIEMALSGAASASEVIPAMLGVHAVIGLAEGAMTAALVLAWAYAAGLFRKMRILA